MSRRNMVNSDIQSQFICLKCLRMDLVSGDGIARLHGQREDNHVKDLWCCNCRERVKTLEVRPGDDIAVKKHNAKIKRRKYYKRENGEYVLKDKYRKGMLDVDKVLMVYATQV